MVVSGAGTAPTPMQKPNRASVACHRIREYQIQIGAVVTPVLLAESDRLGRKWARALVCGDGILLTPGSLIRIALLATNPHKLVDLDRCHRPAYSIPIIRSPQIDSLLDGEWFPSEEMRQFQRSQVGCSFQGRLFLQML